MSLSGTTNTYLPPTLDGLNIIEADAIYINGIPINSDNLVPYTGASKNVNLGTFNFQTLGSITAKQHVFPTFPSTMMTGPTTSSIFYADAWEFNNTIQISSLGGGVFLSTSYLRLADGSNNSTLLTLQSDGIADFANTKVRVSTMASNVYDVVNLSTLQASIAFVENVNALNYVPYTGALQNLNMMGSTITTLGQINAGTVCVTTVGVNADYTLSVNSGDQLEFTNLSNGSIFKTNGADLFVTGNVNCATLGATNVEAGTNIYLAKTSVAEWRTTLGMSDEYEILDNAGVMRLRLSKTTGLTVSTMKITQVPSATPTLALGVNGGGQVVSFAVPTTTGLVPYTGATTTVNLGAQSIYATTARFTGVTSATPSLALGVDVSGNLNTFAVPTATNILPLNNVFTGTNQFNNSVTVYNGLGVASGAFSKQTATAGSLVQITGGGATNSPYLEFLFGGNSRGYIGNASAVDLDLVAQNGAQLNFYTAGAKQLKIDTTGNLTMNILKAFYLYYISATNHAGFTTNGSGDLSIFTGTSGVANRLTITAGGVVTVPNDVVANGFTVNGGGTFQPGCIYTDVNWGMLFRAKVVPAGGIFGWYDSAGTEKMRMWPTGNMTHTAGDNSYMQYGPNATWSSYLFVGASPNRLSSASTAQVITTNGNLHLDAGFSRDMYYGFYANSNGTPNGHRFYGTNYVFETIPENTAGYARVMCLDGNTLRKSQCMQKRLYQNGGVGWGGGVNLVSAFYKWNQTAVVRISGKYSGYWGGSYLAYVYVRIHSQTNGADYGLYLPTFTNNAGNHVTIPLDVVYDGSELPTTGWFDLYIANSSGLSTDTNDQLTLNVSVLPANSF